MSPGQVHQNVYLSSHQITCPKSIVRCWWWASENEFIMNVIQMMQMMSLRKWVHYECHTDDADDEPQKMSSVWMSYRWCRWWASANEFSMNVIQMMQMMSLRKWVQYECHTDDADDEPQKMSSVWMSYRWCRWWASENEFSMNVIQMMQMMSLRKWVQYECHTDDADDEPQKMSSVWMSYRWCRWWASENEFSMNVIQMMQMMSLRKWVQYECHTDDADDEPQKMSSVWMSYRWCRWWASENEFSMNVIQMMQMMSLRKWVQYECHTDDADDEPQKMSSVWMSYRWCRWWASENEFSMNVIQMMQMMSLRKWVHYECHTDDADDEPQKMSSVWMSYRWCRWWASENEFSMNVIQMMQMMSLRKWAPYECHTDDADDEPQQMSSVWMSYRWCRWWASENEFSMNVIQMMQMMSLRKWVQYECHTDDADDEPQKMSSVWMSYRWCRWWASENEFSMNVIQMMQMMSLSKWVQYECHTDDADDEPQKMSSVWMSYRWCRWWASENEFSMNVIQMMQMMSLRKWVQYECHTDDADDEPQQMSSVWMSYRWCRWWASENEFSMNVIQMMQMMSLRKWAPYECHTDDADDEPQQMSSLWMSYRWCRWWASENEFIMNVIQMMQMMSLRKWVQYECHTDDADDEPQKMSSLWMSYRWCRWWASANEFIMNVIQMMQMMSLRKWVHYECHTDDADDEPQKMSSVWMSYRWCRWWASENEFIMNVIQMMQMMSLRKWVQYECHTDDADDEPQKMSSVWMSYRWCRWWASANEFIMNVLQMMQMMSLRKWVHYECHTDDADDEPQKMSSLWMSYRWCRWWASENEFSMNVIQMMQMMSLRKWAQYECHTDDADDEPQKMSSVWMSYRWCRWWASENEFSMNVIQMMQMTSLRKWAPYECHTDDADDEPQKMSSLWMSYRWCRWWASENEFIMNVIQMMQMMSLRKWAQYECQSITPMNTGWPYSEATGTQGKINLHWIFYLPAGHWVKIYACPTWNLTCLMLADISDFFTPVMICHTLSWLPCSI